MFNLFARNSTSVKRISAKDCKDLVEGNRALLIDVRTPDEFRQRRIPGSRNMPLDELAMRAPRLIPDKNQPMVVYCLSGGRSAQACSLLARMGYVNIFDMGGINAWPYSTIRG